ncbi:hypothetical protein BAE44_0000828 [Dichanthelium oligosanthes]|uniref:F-box/kelch-repeat protein n=1 Tax=Dichanthelium oligosanthes TaxID=888268 RepID=A0A1E5WLB5_9POAL|nr:hypothetical protein BAE44_0000828 [Dichanthelium oligosanthes]
MSDFFYPTRPPNKSRGAADAEHIVASSSANNMATIEDARLPRPVITFQPPSSNTDFGIMHFMLFSSTHSAKNQIIGTDQRGNTLLYSMDSHTIRVMPTLNQPKRMPLSLTVGDSLYVMDIFPRPSDTKCFEALTHGCASSDPFSRRDWHWHTLPPPPHIFEPGYELPSGYIRSSTVVGHSNICVSAGNIGTYSFDTMSRVWSKAGDWVLPFLGRAEYIPEYNLWFGLSYADNQLLCASDLSVTSELKPPTLCHVWEDNLRTPEDWVRGMAYVVHLGSGKFCVARFFKTPEEEPCVDGRFSCRESDMFAVLTGVEVERCGKAGRGGLRMITHRSKQYRLANKLLVLVL